MNHNNTNTTKPHPHAELIKAWADGAKIQHFDTSEMQWRDSEQPYWFVQTQYRIKPEEPSNEPWKPNGNEKYFFVGQRNDGLFDVGEYHWGGNIEDNNLFKIGNCFRTREEAEAAVERVKAALKGNLATDNNVAALAESVDYRPLTDGEKALIKALRRTVMGKVYDPDKTVIIDRDGGIDGGLVAKYAPVAFVAFNKRGETLTVAALKQIQEEQETIND